MIAWTKEGLQRLCVFLEAERVKRKLPPVELMEKKAEGLLRRLWNKSQIKNECFICMAVPAARYAHLKFVICHQRGFLVAAHRISYVIYKGFPKNNVCHTCDITHCINPNHLFDGTQKENMMDCAKKGRSNKPKGKDHWKASVSQMEIRRDAT